MNKEIKSLTGIRGIAALWVVFLHYFETINSNGDLYISKLLFSNALIAVDMFFLLSAIVMCVAYSDVFNKKISILSYKSFMKKRFARIYPAYFLWAFMFLLVFDFSNFKFDFAKILVNLLLLQNLFNDSVISIVFWSLCAEWVLYMIFPFLYAFLHKIRTKISCISLIVVSIAGIYLLPSVNNYIVDFQGEILVIYPHGNIAVIKGINSIIRCFFSYMVGINLFLLIRDFYSNITSYWMTFLKYISIIGLFIIPYFGKSDETYATLFVCSIVIISILYIDKDKVDPIFSSKTVYFLGQISYSIYLCHMFILIFASVLVKKFFPLQYDSSMQTYLVIGALICLIPISYLSYIFVEVKTGNWLKSKLFTKPYGGYLKVT